MTKIAGDAPELSAFIAEGDHADLAPLFAKLAAAARDIADLIRRGPFAGELGRARGAANADGDAQKELDVVADAAFIEAMRGAGVRAVLSEEREAPIPLDPDGRLLVAIDPLDGSSNIDVNVSIGTIFSVLDASWSAGVRDADFLVPGTKQRAAGFFIYGPQTHLVFTLGAGTHAAALDPSDGRFKVARPQIAIPRDSSEYAINASNYRHWFGPVKAYVDDCIAGADGPRGREFNMRWTASLVADAYRIFARGGVFLYPSDERRGYSRGRLRHLYEANPIAFLVEQAGGAATDGTDRALDAEPTALHARLPLVFGSIEKVERVRRYHVDDERPASDSPLFARRGLLRN